MIQRYVGTEPAEITSAKNFRLEMETKIISDEVALRTAVARAEAEISRLKNYLTGLDLASYETWGTQAESEMKALGKLIQKWNAQLKHLKKQESLARTYQWQVDKAAELTRRYMEKVTAAKTEGEAQTETIKLLREASEELSNIIRASQMISSTAKTRIQPETLPTGSLRRAIEKFEAILEGLEDQLPESEARWARRRLDVAKYELAKMEGVSATLGYETELESYQKSKSQEGIQYFRANLSEVARQILSERTLAKLEEDLASKGIDAAKDAVAQAIVMAAKQNPEAVRKLVG